MTRARAATRPAAPREARAAFGRKQDERAKTPLTPKPRAGRLARRGAEEASLTREAQAGLPRGGAAESPLTRKLPAGLLRSGAEEVPLARKLEARLPRSGAEKETRLTRKPQAGPPRGAEETPLKRRPPRGAAEETPLARRLEAPARATPQDLYALALEWWRKGERFDIGRMAQELGVSRATVFRWAGSRELLYGEILSSRFEAALARARKEAKGEGPELITRLTERLFHVLVTDEPLKRFVQQDAEYALRILMSKSSTVEQRCAASVRTSLEEGVRLGLIRPVMDLDALAYVIVRIGESFLYRDAITGDPADIGSAITAIRVLLTAEKER